MTEKNNNKNNIINKKNTNYKKTITAAVLGFVIGDALGVPVEFLSREELALNPVQDMRSHGTHNQEAFTWSDDTSMVLATIEWLCESLEEYPANYNSLMDKFCNWLFGGDYTAHEEFFDCGVTVSRAIISYARGEDPLECGGPSENENGNGSLMRMLGVGLWCSSGFSGNILKTTKFIFDMSSLTHGHPRSKVACFIYCKLVADLFRHTDSERPTVAKEVLLEKSLTEAKSNLENFPDPSIQNEIQTYNRLWDMKTFKTLKEEEIRSTGYVVDTLEAALWCFLNSNTYLSCVFRAVNLGGDTDTIGAIAGSLAALFYGIEDVPTDWTDSIPKIQWIMELAEQLAEKIKDKDYELH